MLFISIKQYDVRKTDQNLDSGMTIQTYCISGLAGRLWEGRMDIWSPGVVAEMI